MPCLPDEVFLEALTYLWPIDISRFARTSKRSRRIADCLLYKRNHIATAKHLLSFCQALTSRPSAAKALNMISIDVRDPSVYNERRFPLAAIGAALFASPNLTHLAVALPHPRDPKHYLEPTPLLYACGPALRELTLTANVPTAALTEFLMTHPNLVSLSLPNQSTESVVELPAECVPLLTSVTAPPALVACLVPDRPVTNVVISRPVPRAFMADVVESLAASSGPVVSLGMETEEVTLGVMQEVTVRLRELRTLWVKGRFVFMYSLTYSGLLLDIAPLLGRSSALTSVSLIGWPAIQTSSTLAHSHSHPKSPTTYLSVSPSTPSASFTPSPSPPPPVDHSILEDELQVTRTFHACAKQLREIVFPSGCRWVAKRDDDETTWEPARECHNACIWWADREVELELAAAQQEAHRIEQLENMGGRGRKHGRRSMSRPPGSSDDSEDELDYARIELSDGDVDADGEGVDELFESEQGLLLS